MKLVYIDEAGDEDTDRWFVLGSLVIDESNFMPFNKVEEAAKTRLRQFDDLPNDLTLDGLDDLWKYDYKYRKKAAYYVYDVLNELTNYNAISVVVDCNKARNFNHIKSSSDIYLMAFTNLLERIELTIRQKYQFNRAVVFVDERDDKTWSKIREHHYEIKSGDVESYHGDPLTYIGIATPLRDDASGLMSLADWIAKGTRAHIIDNSSDYYRRFYERIPKDEEESVIRYGVKVIPDDSVSELPRHPDKKYDFDIPDVDEN